MWEEGRENAPRHTTDLEIPQVPSILLFRPSRELRREELHGRHCGDERVDVVLREVATTRCVCGVMSV